ncbi:MAG: nitroreductase/quinone reductase family protein [Actinomycetota bacterium]
MADLSLRSAFRALNSVVVPAVRRGVGSPLPVGVGLVLLETTGRRSGKVREVPLVGFRVLDRVAVSTVRSDSQWLRNLEADADGGVWTWGRRRDVRADVTRGPLNVAVLEPR